MVYNDASDNACGAQLSKEDVGQELPVTVLTHTPSWKLNANGAPQNRKPMGYTMPKSSRIITSKVQISSCAMITSPCRSVLMEKNTNNKVNCWSLELATYNITFKWISGAHNKAADCLSRLVEVPEHNAPAISILINTVTVLTVDRSTTHTQSKTKVQKPPNRCWTTSHSRWQGYPATDALDRPLLQTHL